MVQVPDPREIVMDAQGWNTPDDLYDSFFRAVGAPSWHGRSFNAVRDSICARRINKLEIPYLIRLKNYSLVGAGAKSIAEEFIDLIKRLHDSGYAVNVEVEN